MGTRKRKILRKKIEDKEARLSLYRAAEQKILNGDVQAYGIGSRNLSRYPLDLASIRDEIEKLEEEIADLEAQLDGCKARKAVAAVPRDW